MRLEKLFLLFIMSIGLSVQAQQKFSISGNITDASTGEALIGVLIRADGAETSGGAYTNEYGFYSITLPAGEYRLHAYSIGFDSLSQQVVLTQDVRQDIKLLEEAVQIGDVVITAKKDDENVTQAQMGVIKLDMREINKIPVLFGERDILKSMQLLPGVKSSGEGNGGLYVRGGEASQNLILLDEAPVYNAYHLLGFFSTFNSDAIKDVALFKGSAPAQYGGRLSSVIDVKMNEGNNQSYHVSGGIGIIASHLNVEGPIVKDKGSFLITGRRTYADVFLRLSSNENLQNTSLYFYDVNAKANYSINDNNKLFLSGYFGRDKLGLDAFGIDWGNTTGTLRWNHLINSKWFSNTSFIISDYNYQVGISSNSADFSLTSGIRDYNVKQEFQYFGAGGHKLRMGFNSIHHTVKPGQVTLGDSSTFQPPAVQNRSGLESAAFISDEWDASTRIKLNYGLRASMFNALGGGDFYSYDAEGNLTDTTTYANNEIVNTTWNLEPRLSIAYTLGASNSIKASYARNSQYLHMVSNATATSPTDVWLISSPNILPEISDQVAAGYFQNFGRGMYESSVELYYKSMQNQIDLRNGADIQANEFLEGEIVSGIGRAYGMELFFKKRRGIFTGWVSYTLSRTERKIDEINNGNWYLAKQDAKHDVAIVGMLDISKRWSVSANWVFKTGNAVTFPTGKYEINGQTFFLYTERNGYRLPAYHRLDVSATLQGKKRERFENSWNFACYNAYGRQNPYSVDFREDPSDPSKTQVVQTSLFRWIPSITYNFKF